MACLKRSSNKITKKIGGREFSNRVVYNGEILCQNLSGEKWRHLWEQIFQLFEFKIWPLLLLIMWQFTKELKVYLAIVPLCF